MELPSKRCKMCHQFFPILPHLPVEIIDKILSYLPFKLHVEIVGVSAATRCRALRHPDRFVYYFKHTPIVDDAFATYWAIENDDPARPYVGELCRFESPRAAQQFFNEHVPRSVALGMLNLPYAGSDRVLSRRWGWWRLARALLQHEARCGRGRLPSKVRVADDDVRIDEKAIIFDANLSQFDAQPDSIATVLFDDDYNIEVYMCGDRMYVMVI
ncbi:late expression factor 7 [Choristoneura fumiferana multiple nucleopolyhedrovirus]|uniref:Late expression factor 7 n=1 Tax=Choristoneura fumiferana nuclear polyhedrosis virus TaxID=208973 RepID=Q7TLN4_NPVCF|nr:late expression factor 7 [Choristoneura fumiferana multiple nucleopolyhedrovirus]AAP29897.1 late expression factor 7 [Choristoneura fumiferana multiple nucleopolyhedrovirus]AGR56922.1 LEF-7 [Choristoneura occidentalis alphabaculovirus]